MIELDCLKKALEGKTKGWRGVPVDTFGVPGRHPRQQMAEIVRGDVVAVCDVIGNEDPWVKMKRESCNWGSEEGRLLKTVVMYADDVFKLVEMCEAALAKKV